LEKHAGTHVGQVHPVSLLNRTDNSGKLTAVGRARADRRGLQTAPGELLVQYRLLKIGIDSARLTTDAGIDLVVYAPGTAKATTVQVKSNLAATPAGGKRQLSRGWHFPDACPAQLLALVALDLDRVWLFTIDEARELAQQHSPSCIRKLYWSCRRRPEVPPELAAKLK
jgi:hypothetical protein